MTSLKRKSLPSTLHTASDTSKRSSSTTQKAQVYLGPLLPAGWQSYFDVRRAGKYWGLSIVCPTCGEAPPKDLLGGRRWRWLSVHIAKHKPVRLAK